MAAAMSLPNSTATIFYMIRRYYLQSWENAVSCWYKTCTDKDKNMFSDWESHSVRRAVRRLCQSVTQFVTTQDLFQTQTDYRQDGYQVCGKCRLGCRTNKHRKYNLGSLIVEIRNSSSGSYSTNFNLSLNAVHSCVRKLYGGISNFGCLSLPYWMNSCLIWGFFGEKPSWSAGLWRPGVW
jgi:hypothetical protein